MDCTNRTNGHGNGYFTPEERKTALTRNKVYCCLLYFAMEEKKPTNFLFKLALTDTYKGICERNSTAAFVGYTSFCNRDEDALQALDAAVTELQNTNFFQTYGHFTKLDDQDYLKKVKSVANRVLKLEDSKIKELGFNKSLLTYIADDEISSKIAKNWFQNKNDFEDINSTLIHLELEQNNF